MPEEKEIFVDVRKEKQGLVINSALHRIAAGLGPSFRSIDETYLSDPRQYLVDTVGDIEKIKIHETGQEAACSFIYDQDTPEASEALIIFAPFSDIEPRTSADNMLAFLAMKPDAISTRDRLRAQPHSYNQAIKSKTIHDLLKLHGMGMPVITVFSPIHPKVYNPDEQTRFRKGDFSPASHVVQAAISSFEDRVHGPGNTRIARIHFNGLSLGASNARGAAAGSLYSSVFKIESFTGQEMVMGPDKFPRIPRLGARFVLKQQIDIPGQSSPVDNRPKIVEPQLRRDLTARGNEPQMFAQIARAMTRWTFLTGLTRSRPAKRDLIDLDKAGVPVTIAGAFNSGLTQETQEPLQIGDLSPHFTHQQKILVRAIEGERVGHELNELVAPTASIALAGILHAAKRR